jgi:hypothetical protein
MTSVPITTDAPHTTETAPLRPLDERLKELDPAQLSVVRGEQLRNGSGSSFDNSFDNIGY